MHIRLERDRSVSFIAITGGPGGGKTTFMAHARQYLEDHGFRVIVVPETATEIIQAGFHVDERHWADKLNFQRLVLQLSLAREAMYERAVKRMRPQKPAVLLCDRGTVDGLAYVDPEEFGALLLDIETPLETLRRRYDGVIHMMTAAEGAEGHYTLENNTARHESPEVARERDRRTREAWHGVAHMAIIDNSTGFDEKVTRALKALARFLAIPEPIERERRFLVHGLDPHAIPRSAVKVRITQDYLTVPDGSVSRRVRKRVVDGVETFYYTEKSEGSRPGERHEHEREITPLEYAMFLEMRDPAAQTVVKTRFCFSHGRHYLELDIFEAPLKAKGKAIVEAEVSDLDDHVTLPVNWVTKDVTEERGYSNFDIAYGRSNL